MFRTYHSLLTLAALGALSACAGNPSTPASTRAADDGHERVAVALVLDDWHRAASVADEAVYMGHFAPDAVFLGTDASERWTFEQFTDYVHTRFVQGTSWTYHPHERHVAVSTDRTIAWFDEKLTSGKYGELRGTGVCVKLDGAWKITHYNMTFTVPNEVARDVVNVIKVYLGEEPLPPAR